MPSGDGLSWMKSSNPWCYACIALGRGWIPAKNSRLAKISARGLLHDDWILMEVSWKGSFVKWQIQPLHQKWSQYCIFIKCILLYVFWLLSGGIRSYKLSVIIIVILIKYDLCPRWFHYFRSEHSFQTNKFKQFRTCQITMGFQSIQKGDLVSSAIIHPNVGKINATPRGEIPPIQTWSWTNTWDRGSGGSGGCQQTMVTNLGAKQIERWIIFTVGMFILGGPVIVNLYDVNLNITIDMYRMHYTNTCIICTCIY